MPDGTNNLVSSWAWLIICLSIVQALAVTMWRDNLCRLKCLYKRPQMGLLAFFTVVASSQISPHIASWGLLYLYDTAKIGTFVRILFICPMFFSFRQCFLTICYCSACCYASSFKSWAKLFLSTGCKTSGAISASGCNTKSRLCISGWGTVSLSVSMVSFP